MSDITKLSKAKQKLFSQIAKDTFCIDTLESRNRDSLDFHDVSVRCVTSAFNAIYEHQQKKINALNRRIKKTKTKKEILYQGVCYGSHVEDNY